MNRSTASTTQIALLRGVNVVGRRMVAMSGLRECLGAIGFADVRTLLQSGNLVFRCDGPTGEDLEQLLEAEFLKRLNLQTHVIVRSARQWERIVAGNPFMNEAREDPSHLLAMVAKRRVAPKAFAALQAAVAKAGGCEAAGESNGQVYICYPDGVGRSRVTTALIERALGTPVTGRNWNTVLKLADACGASPARVDE
jgi:uncharacterized protein (DUF1697 family)